MDVPLSLFFFMVYQPVLILLLGKDLLVNVGASISFASSVCLTPSLPEVRLFLLLISHYFAPSPSM